MKPHGRSPITRFGKGGADDLSISLTYTPAHADAGAEVERIRHASKPCAPSVSAVSCASRARGDGGRGLGFGGVNAL